MDKIKKLVLFRIPMSICNFRCHYCYLSQRPIHFQGNQPQMKYTPDQVAKAMTQGRLGGIAYMNFCADGETLLTKDIDKYIKALVEEGHYAEIVTNLTVTPVLEKILSWDKKLLKRIEFKCSFHYLELNKKGFLDRFAENVKKIWDAGASANIEITPSDELIPYIDEVIDFSMQHFGALPHVTIARNDNTKEIEYLTNLPIDEYDSVWSRFDSDFWKFKKTIFGKRQKDFCYAGDWSIYIDITTGEATPCYCAASLGDVFANPNEPLPRRAVGKCPIAHCYNGHALMTLGCIPKKYRTRYGDIRDKTKSDGTHWLQPELLDFFNSKLEETNTEYSAAEKAGTLVIGFSKKILRKAKSVISSANK